MTRHTHAPHRLPRVLKSLTLLVTLALVWLCSSGPVPSPALVDGDLVKIKTGG